MEDTSSFVKNDTADKDKNNDRGMPVQISKKQKLMFEQNMSDVEHLFEVQRNENLESSTSNLSKILFENELNTNQYKFCSDNDSESNDSNTNNECNVGVNDRDSNISYDVNNTKKTRKKL